MRILIGTLVFSASVAWWSIFCGPALAGASDEEKVAKVARKYAIPSDTIFTSAFKPKVACYCNGVFPHRLGALTINPSGTHVSCAIPTTVGLDGNFVVVDFGCQDIQILTK
jgi:hypothetical protein